MLDLPIRYSLLPSMEYILQKQTIGECIYVTRLLMCYWCKSVWRGERYMVIRSRVVSLISE